MSQMHALDEGLVFVRGEQCAQGVGIESLQQQHVAGPVAGEEFVRQQGLDLRRREALGLHLVLRFVFSLAAHQRLHLRQAVGQQQVVHVCVGIGRGRYGDEVGRDQMRALVQQLEIGMLAAVAQAAPVDRTGLVVDRQALRT